MTAFASEYKALLSANNNPQGLVPNAICISIDELPERLGTHDRLLGLDFGTKTIGMALSDLTRTIATPLETLRRTKFSQDAERLQDVIAEHDVAALVIGLPINLDGSEGPRAQSTRAFARNIAGRVDVPIVLWDERLSTVAVERTLIEADVSRKRRREVVDKMAAAFILQGALDRLKDMA